MKYKRTNIYLGEDQIPKLEILSEKERTSVSALIRRAIDEYLKREERTMKKLVIAFLALAMMVMAVPAMALTSTHATTATCNGLTFTDVRIDWTVRANTLPVTIRPFAAPSTILGVCVSGEFFFIPWQPDFTQ